MRGRALEVGRAVREGARPRGAVHVGDHDAVSPRERPDQLEDGDVEGDARDGQPHLTRSPTDDLVHAGAEVGKLRVLDEHALRLAGGAGRVDGVGQPVVDGRGRAAQGVVVARRSSDVEHLDAGQQPGRRRRRQRDCDSAVGQHVLDPRRGVAGVDGQERAAGQPGGQDRDDEVVGARQAHGDGCAVSHAPATQARGDAPGPVDEPGVGEARGRVHDGDGLGGATGLRQHPGERVGDGAERLVRRDRGLDGRRQHDLPERLLGVGAELVGHGDERRGQAARVGLVQRAVAELDLAAHAAAAGSERDADPGLGRALDHPRDAEVVDDLPPTEVGVLLRPVVQQGLERQLGTREHPSAAQRLHDGGQRRALPLEQLGTPSRHRIERVGGAAVGRHLAAQRERRGQEPHAGLGLRVVTVGPDRAEADVRDPGVRRQGPGRDHRPRGVLGRARRRRPPRHTGARGLGDLEGGPTRLVGIADGRRLLGREAAQVLDEPRQVVVVAPGRDRAIVPDTDVAELQVGARGGRGRTGQHSGVRLTHLVQDERESPPVDDGVVHDQAEHVTAVVPARDQRPCERTVAEVEGLGLQAGQGAVLAGAPLGRVRADDLLEHAIAQAERGPRASWSDTTWSNAARRATRSVSAGSATRVRVVYAVSCGSSWCRNHSRRCPSVAGYADLPGLRSGPGATCCARPAASCSSSQEARARGSGGTGRGGRARRHR